MFNIVIIFIASMLLYLSKEMIYPLLPLYLNSHFGLEPGIIALIESITKCISSILRFYSGYFSDLKKKEKNMF